MPKNTIEIRLTKSGPNGRPYAEVLVPAKASLEQLVSAQKVLPFGVGFSNSPTVRKGHSILTVGVPKHRVL